MKARTLFALTLLALTALTASAAPRRRPPIPKPVAIFGESYRENLTHVRACEESLATPGVVASLNIAVADASGATVEQRALAALAESPRVVAITYHPFTVYLLTRTSRAPRVRTYRVAVPAIEGEALDKRQARLAVALRRTLERVSRIR